jgi:hypothetical protein
MHIELIDSLRCIADHESTWLVASIGEMNGRHITRGTLGCPVCGAEYAVRDGVVDLRGPSAQLTTDAPDDGLAPEALLRIAALLDLSEPGGIVILGGRWGALAADLAKTYDVQCLALNPPPRVVADGDVSVVLVSERAGLAAAFARGAAVDAALAAGPARFAGVVDALRPQGRLIAPAATTLPVGVELVARDDAELLARRLTSDGGLVPLRRPRP